MLMQNSLRSIDVSTWSYESNILLYTDQIYWNHSDIQCPHEKQRIWSFFHSRMLMRVVSVSRRSPQAIVLLPQKRECYEERNENNRWWNDYLWDKCTPCFLPHHLSWPSLVCDGGFSLLFYKRQVFCWSGGGDGYISVCDSSDSME